MARPDPSLSAIRFVKQEVRRLDELRVQEVRHAHEIRDAESKRLDANLDSLKQLIKSTQDTATIQLNRLTELVSALQLEQSKDKGKSAMTTPVIAAIFSFITGILAYIAARYLK